MSKIDDILNDRQMNLFGEMQVSEEKMKLQSEYIIPPFSVLRGASGYWQSRKNAWSIILKDKGDGRNKNLTFGSFRSFGKDGNAFEDLSTSIFDPVLCEIMYKWFTAEEMLILDPFSGGITRGGGCLFE